ncbi:maggie [Culex quinquefasciatus]|uniref:Mitochondrial import receptor subunit TOM22 homolog n=1 Tax=Culex quinquefasciatus TaxID=7176 RepID=B0WII3_CULQU|nr:maggie [Culex quinquefasciatus]|eukprot:XP_001848517.1 maggie [Culex quinquefasciatus]
MRFEWSPLEPDESLSERLWGLTEMFPAGVRNLTGAVVSLSAASVKTLYQFSCSASWIFFTSSMILFAPVVFEVERAQMEEMQRSQQKQVLLGPGSAVGGGGPGGMPALPRCGTIIDRDGECEKEQLQVFFLFR